MIVFSYKRNIAKRIILRLMLVEYKYDESIENLFSEKWNAFGSFTGPHSVYDYMTTQTFAKLDNWPPPPP